MAPYHVSRCRPHRHWLEVSPRSRPRARARRLRAVSGTQAAAAAELGADAVRYQVARRSRAHARPSGPHRLLAAHRPRRIMSDRSTVPTRRNELAEIILLDSAKCQEQDADYANRKGYSKHKPALPLYEARDVRTSRAIASRRSSAANGFRRPNRSGCATTTPGICWART